MDKDVTNLCIDFYEKLNNNLAHYEKMLEITQILATKSLDSEVELSNKMLEQRQDFINEINKNNKEINLIQNEICQKIGLEDFNLELIQSYIAKDLYDNLINLIAIIQKVIMQIQVLDEDYRYNAELAKEETKRLLHRTLRAHRPQQSYRQFPVQEARFIDKER